MRTSAPATKTMRSTPTSQDLQEGVVYHFRVVATNQYGSTATEDQTFNFFPPECPNSKVRQQTGSLYLPDCRAYELVSPEEAGNVILVPAPWLPTGQATSPARFAFGGILGGVTGTEPTNSISADTYVATRSTNGWHTSYIGLVGSKTLGTDVQATNLDMSRFLSFRIEAASKGSRSPRTTSPTPSSAENEFLGRWPVGWNLIPGGAATKAPTSPRRTSATSSSPPTTSPSRPAASSRPPARPTTTTPRPGRRR